MRTVVSPDYNAAAKLQPPRCACHVRQYPRRLSMKLLSSLLGCAALAILCSINSQATASSAFFEISCAEHKLGEASEETAEQPPQYRLKVQEGASITLVAQGVVSPRGGKNSPSEPDAGAWLFDDEAWKLEPLEVKNRNETKVVIRLKAIKPGKTRVRFVGNILGYDRRYDVTVEVAPAGD